MRLRFLLLVLFWGGSLNCWAEPPAYFNEALRRFVPDAPPGWAYTVTTTRGEETAVERYDPGRPLEERWTLLQRNGRPPTPDEVRRHRNYRITTSNSTLRATFQRGDIDPASVRLVQEDANEAEFLCRFRGDLKDQLLEHLELHLLVAKQPAAVRRYVLVLTAPFSPVLALKMIELRIEMNFGPPPRAGAPRPTTTSSHFRGRFLFFKTIAEDETLAYSDFAPVRISPPGN
jgi:hypothetical protein